MLTPTNVIHATVKYVMHRYAKPASLTQIGLDARVATGARDAGKPTVLVIVLGETARAADFVRTTTPKLASEPVLYFQDVTACGTSTAVSLPCMFSDLGEQHYDDNTARSRENLLDVLTHAGVEVIWRDNNSGCKHVCDRVEYERLVSKQAGLCNASECYDEILLEGLQERIAKLTQDTVIVLHQNGSHGPDYFRRYPDRFERYRPACKSTDLSKCDAKALRNAYDNTIAYTDYIVWQVLETVEHSTDVNGAMVYISDHGESLGEHGLYLHGMPKLLAPDVQLQVPMVVWFSRGYAVADQLDRSCAVDHAARHHSHDNLFHTVLGLLDVETSLYQPALDVFSNCRARHASTNSS